MLLKNIKLSALAKTSLINSQLKSYNKKLLIELWLIKI